MRVRAHLSGPRSWRINYVIDARPRAVGFEVTSSAPPPPTSAPHIRQCWTQDTGGSNSNWNPASAISSVSASQIIARGTGSYRVIANLDRNPPADLIGVVTLTLIQPKRSGLFHGDGFQLAGRLRRLGV